MAGSSISDEEFDAEIRLRAARRAQVILKREGAALVLSARELNESAIAADRQLLAIAIAQAIIDAFDGDIEGIEESEP